MQNIDDNLQKFWEIETINEGQKQLSKEEEYCENHYQMTCTHNEAGRYVVQMPVKDIQGLGHSKGLPMKRLDQLWRRLSKEKQMENLYREFMQYLDLGHMEKVEEHSDETSANNICYYLPHHGVFRPDKTTTKLRVVFNGSASTTSGLSLNDLLLKAQRDFLRIIRKTGANEEPVIYRLKTVTYGTAKAPFLAIRNLKHLAMDEASRFPLASKVALQDVYMDDLASYTKRDVLSVIARLYDPLGLIGPVISKAKIFLQKLWLRKLNWEEFLPDAIAPEWLNFMSSLKALEELKIDRYILTYSYVKVMLLGYTDASESAYGAMVYMHSVKEEGTTTTKLIGSKSRVAPIEVISIPRLELSAGSISGKSSPLSTSTFSYTPIQP
ncbi:integrase catalytic domain-containing protein [Trichonephila clavipes]|nr:integrase catalytic domain-containing protein [Trichonephila clavipes]